ncbi:MAG: methyltransferase domain-containing protein [Alphaproteobacteria bacterium]|nr:methyltransferase domain-containing protein [Alphaproteobacteria bacterium]
MANLCELCFRDALELAYQPESSTRGLTVHVCQHCGLVQSLPRIDRATRAPAAVSGGADWGNVRYGKGFRTQAAIAALKRHANLESALKVLDVGSNRGSFARTFLDLAPNAELTAVEPDERVAAYSAGLERTRLIESRIEDAVLGNEAYDVVHSCHTAEHLGDPLMVFADHWRVLKPGGILLVDVPNIALLDSDDILEEWFIDKHLYHFSARTLMRMVAAAGFETICPPDATDRENLLLVARKSGVAHRAVEGDQREVDEAERLIATYVSTRARNLMALTAAAAEISSYAPRKVAMWGAGRLFDSLVTHGGFQPAGLSLLIDKHLKAHMTTRHGAPLAGPEALRDTSPDVLVVMSRGFSSEIVSEAKTLAPHAEIILYGDLLKRARKAQAA